MFEFTLFLPKVCFSVFRLEQSKNLSIKLARVAQAVKRCFTVIV